MRVLAIKRETGVQVKNKPSYGQLHLAKTYRWEVLFQVAFNSRNKTFIDDSVTWFFWDTMICQLVLYNCWREKSFRMQRDLAFLWTITPNFPNMTKWDRSIQKNEIKDKWREKEKIMTRWHKSPNIEIEIPNWNKYD